MRILIWLFIIAATLIADPITVTFVNPGDADDPFFSRLCNTMTAAAEDLDLSLEILYSGRDYIRGLEVGKTVFDREKQPDFLLLINENGMAERLVEQADSLGIKTVVFNEGFSEAFIKRVGDPVEVFKNCIVELLPDDSLAGYLLAKGLIAEKRKSKPEGPITIFGITGSPRNTSSQKREAGLKKAVSESKDVKLLQTAPAHWKDDKAYEITTHSFKRYSEIDIIWAASDKMAEGVLKSIKELKKDCIIGGIDWAVFAFDLVENGDFAATVGGHFFDGAWVLVLISDYVSNGGLPQKKFLSSSYDIIVKNSASDLIPILKNDKWGDINFSKYKNAKSGKYDFSLQKIWDELNVSKQ